MVYPLIVPPADRTSCCSYACPCFSMHKKICIVVSQVTFTKPTTNQQPTDNQHQHQPTLEKLSSIMKAYLCIQQPKNQKPTKNQPPTNHQPTESQPTFWNLSSIMTTWSSRCSIVWSAWCRSGCSATSRRTVVQGPGGNVKEAAGGRARWGGGGCSTKSHRTVG